MADHKTLTTAEGIPVADDQNSLTAGDRGPILMQDFHLMEKLAHFNRERIPERVVHAKGAAAFGTFTVTHDITRYSRAKLFSEIGKETQVLLRCSTVGGEKGSADAENIVSSLSQARQDIQMRQLCHFFRADVNYGRQVAAGYPTEP